MMPFCRATLHRTQTRFRCFPSTDKPATRRTGVIPRFGDDCDVRRCWKHQNRYMLIHPIREPARGGLRGARARLSMWVQFNNICCIRGESKPHPVPAHPRPMLFTQRNQKPNVKSNACNAKCRYYGGHQHLSPPTPTRALISPPERAHFIGYDRP